jgi:hypothetical protein
MKLSCACINIVHGCPELVLTDLNAGVEERQHYNVNDECCLLIKIIRN